jgi:cell shape-determining protein MreC
MTSSDQPLDRAGWTGWIRPSLLPWIAVCVCTLLPEDCYAPLRNGLAIALRPGLLVCNRARDRVTAFVHKVQHASTTAERLTTLEEQNRELAAKARQLELALQLAQTEAASLRQQNTSGPAETVSLMATHALQTRVLGSQARNLLAGHAVLDAGASAGLKTGAPVLGEAQLDLGADAGVDAGQLVFLGAEVWGQVASVDDWTSTAQHVTQIGYRDLVQLAQANGDRLRLGPQGVLEGTGEPLCRIRMIAITEPVAVGDLVLTDGGALPSATLCYGRVVRVEQPRGAAHWEIWMQPAIASPQLHGTVAVLRTELNPERVGAAATNLK